MADGQERGAGRDGRVPRAVWDKLGALDTAQAEQRESNKAMGSRLDRIETLVEKMGSHFDAGMERVEAWMRHAGRPNYGWMISAAGFLLMMVSAIGGLAFLPLRANDIVHEDLLRSHSELIQSLEAQDAVIAATRFTRADGQAQRAYDDEMRERLRAELMRELVRTEESLRREMELRIALEQKAP